MELKTLRSFLAIAREGNVTAAAESLHVTQPTLSRQLATLEEELGTPLFLRGSRKLTLTEGGARFRKRIGNLQVPSVENRKEWELAYSALLR